MGAGQQKRIEDQLLRAQALEDVETRPIAEDIAGRDEILGNLQGEIKEILGRRGGDPGVAAQDIAKAIGRIKRDPFFMHNIAALEQAEQAEKVRSQILGRGQTPLGIDLSALQTPLQDPKTGKFNQIGFDIRQAPDFASIIDDQYSDLTARKTEGLPVDVGIPGKKQMITRTRLSPVEIEAQAAAGVDTFISSAGGMITAKASMIQEGLIPVDATDSDVRKAAEDLIAGQLADKVRDDLDRQIIDVGEKPTKTNYDGLGIGSDIDAIIVPENDTQRIFTIQTEVPRTDPVTGKIQINPQTGESFPVPGEPQDITFTSENKFTILQNTATKKNYTLFVSPQKGWSLTNYNTPITLAAQEDFEVETVQDFEVLKEDAVIGGVEYKAGQPLPDEVLFGTEEGTQMVSTNLTERKFFAVGRINKLQEDEESIAVPYEFVKKPIRAKTSTDGVGGFELDPDDFFGSQIVTSGTAGLY